MYTFCFSFGVGITGFRFSGLPPYITLFSVFSLTRQFLRFHEEVLSNGFPPSFPRRDASSNSFSRAPYPAGFNLPVSAHLRSSTVAFFRHPIGDSSSSTFFQGVVRQLLLHFPTFLTARVISSHSQRSFCQDGMCPRLNQCPSVAPLVGGPVEFS